MSAQASHVIVLTGPTASGKSSWALKLAGKIDGAIIAADSRTVYRELNIGAGKVTTEYPATWRESEFGPVATVEGIDHYGLNLVGLATRFTVADFQALANRLIPALLQSGKQPLLVGGTGLYLSAVIEGYVFSGRHQKVRRAPPWVSHTFVVDRPRRELHERIDERVDDRLAQGMLAEVGSLIDAGWTERLIRLGLEYRILTEYLIGNKSDGRLAATVQHLKYAIHAYARRQLTWWRRVPDATWVSSYTELETRVQSALKRT